MRINKISAVAIGVATISIWSGLALALFGAMYQAKSLGIPELCLMLVEIPLLLILAVGIIVAITKLWNDE